MDLPPTDTFVRRFRRARRVLALLAVIVFVLGLIGLGRVVYDPDVLVYFGRDMPERQALEAIEDSFGRTNEVVFVVRGPDSLIATRKGRAALAWLSAEAAALPEAFAVRSIVEVVGRERRGDGPDVFVAMAPGAIRASAKQAGRAARAVLSRDETVAAVAAIVPRDSRHDIAIGPVERAARAVQDAFHARYPGLEVMLTGRLVIDVAFQTEAQEDVYGYAAAQFVVLTLLLLLALGSLAATFALVAIVSAATVATLGAIGWLGVPLNGISSAAPSVLLGLGIASGVHLVMAWQGELRRGAGGEAALAAALRRTAAPITLSVLTTIASFLCLNFAASPPFRQLGNVVAAGLVVILVFVLVVLPVLLLAIPRSRAGKGLALERSMTALGRFTTRHRRALVGLFVAVTALAVAGTARLSFDDTFSHYFDERYEIRRATDLFEEKLSGTIIIDFAVPVAEAGRPFAADHVAKVRAFTDWLAARPEVADVLSVATMADDVGASAPALFDEDGLPADDAATALLRDAYDAALARGMIGLIDRDGRHSRVDVVLRGVSSADTLALAHAAEARAAAIFGEPVRAAGTPILSAQLSLDSARTMLVAMAAALVAVSGLMMLAMRSLSLGLISLLPNLIPAVIAYGIWGITVGEVSFAATVVGALTFGIVVDDTVHIMMHYRAARARLPAPAAIEATLRSVGVAVVTTSVALGMSFAAFTFSGFLVNQHLGYLTALTIVAALFADLLFLPPILVLLDGWRAGSGGAAPDTRRPARRSSASPAQPSTARGFRSPSS